MNDQTPAHSGSLVEALEQFFSRYLALREGVALILALWTIATCLAEEFDSFGYLAITSPTKQCGKSLLGDLLRLVANKGRSTVGLTGPGLFRIIERDKPTLIIDEAEILSGKTDRASDLREILNAGYRKGQTVIRCNPPNYDPKEYRVYGPKAIILIGRLPDTIADRCIPIRMKRRSGETVARFRFHKVQEEAREIQARIGEWVSGNTKAVVEWYQNNDLTLLADREAEIWLPVASVCAVAALHRLAELETIASELGRL